MLRLTSSPTLRPTLSVLGLVVAFVLSACGGAVPLASWPGLVANDQYAFVANGAHVYAVDLSTGKEAWRFPAQGQANELFASDPAVSGDMLIFGSEGPTSSFSGVIFGVDMQGVMQWCLTFDAAGQTRWGKPDAPCQTAPNGTQPLVMDYSLPADNRSLGGIAVSNGMAFFGMANNLAYAINAETGEHLWSFEAEHPVWATPLIVDNTVYYVSLDHNVYARDLQTGAEKWTKTLNASIGGTPAYAEGVLYVGTFANQVLALDATTGAEKWEQPFATTNWVWGGPVIKDGTLYFADLNGQTYAVEAKTGQQKWSTPLNSKVRASVTLVGDNVIVVDKDSKVHALKQSDGTAAWAEPTALKGQLLTPPLYTPGKETILIAPYLGDNMLVGLTVDGKPTSFAFQPSQ